jgi:hypothetical protein
VERIIERGYRNRREVSDRLRQLRDAGYHGVACDDADGETITIIVDGGKRGVPLDRVPPRSLPN